MMPSACLGRAAWGRRGRRAVLAVAVSSLLATPAVAAVCGDSVDGDRVPCGCGDVVASDTVLDATDPVVVDRCPGNGLLVLAPDGSDGITLDLGGQSIVGSGRGSGIRVVRGGALGSAIIGGDAGGGGGATAEIAGFDTGIRVHGASDLRELRDVHVHHNERYGLRLRGSGARIEDVQASANGRDGVQLSGHGNAVSGLVSSDNRRDGIRVRGSEAVLEAETVGNAGHGVVVAGRDNRVQALRSQGNAGQGVVATGSGHDLSGVAAEGNGGGADAAGRPVR